MWWIKPLVSLGMSAMSQKDQKAPPKFERTTDEQSIIDKLKIQSTKGFNVNERIRQGSRTPLDIAHSSKADTLGRMEGSGMTNSIITDELLRKTDKRTQEQIIKMSHGIANENERYKTTAQGKLQNIYFNEGDKQRTSDQEQTDFKNQQREDSYNMGFDFIDSIAGGWGSNKDYEEGESNQWNSGSAVGGIGSGVGSSGAGVNKTSMLEWANGIINDPSASSEEKSIAGVILGTYG